MDTMLKNLARIFLLTILIVGIFSATSSVKAENIRLKEVSIEPYQVELKANESKQLKAKITPSNSTNKNVKWSILTGKEYIVVSADGTITAKNVTRTEEATIQVTTEEKNETAICKVTIKPNETKTNSNTNTNKNTSTDTNTKTPTSTTTNDNTSRHNTNIKPQIGNQELKVNDKIKFIATSWYVYSNKTLAISTRKSKVIKSGDICIVKSIDGNAVEVTDENKKDIGYIYWNNTTTGAKSNFELVSKSTEKSTNISTKDSEGISKLFSNILKKILPQAIEATKTIATSLIKKSESIEKENTQVNKNSTQTETKKEETTKETIQETKTTETKQVEDSAEEIVKIIKDSQIIDVLKVTLNRLLCE